MRIVLAAHSLAGLGGLETYVVTVADHLQRLGHDVWLHSPEHGRATEMATRLGVRVCDEHDLPPAPDVLVVQDAIVSYTLAAHYPLTPQLFVAHSDIFDLALPPQIPGVAQVVVTLYDRVAERIAALALAFETVRLSQPIDVERFKASRPIRAQPRVAMTLGNYVHGPRLEMIARACARVGVELRHVGAHSEAGALESERVYDDADIVFGKARVILEAMACGRAAYVLDHNGGDGWVTPESYERLAPDNFGGQGDDDLIDEERLVRDLLDYDPAMGIVNRDLVVAHHAASAHAAALISVLARLAPRPAPVAAPLDELARLIRTYHRVDMQNFGLIGHNSYLAAQLHACELELDAARAAIVEQAGDAEHAAHAGQAANAKLEAAHVAELEALRVEAANSLEVAHRARDAARFERDAHAAKAAQVADALAAVTRTRRWRATQAVLAPAGRLRRRRRAAVIPNCPAPFVVGVPRSGTTLLRFMFDANTELAIGPDTGFGLIDSTPTTPQDLLAAVTALETWPDLGLDADEARALLGAVEPWSIGGGLRVLYRTFAAHAGKARWGDKTPAHLQCMPAIARSLPEAHFIHIIRDGRDVAASLRGLPFAPGDGGIEAIAGMWSDQIRTGRKHGRQLPHYRELRYDRLVHEPELVLRELCEFIDLDFQPTMLRPQDRASQRLAELPDVRALGSHMIEREQRIANHIHTLGPLDPSRSGRWTQSLTTRDVERFEAVAGDLLDELGYR